MSEHVLAALLRARENVSDTRRGLAVTVKTADFQTGNRTCLLSVREGCGAPGLQAEGWRLAEHSHECLLFFFLKTFWGMKIQTIKKPNESYRPSSGKVH